MFADLSGVTSYSRELKEFYEYVAERFRVNMEDMTGGNIVVVQQQQIDGATRKALEEGLAEFFIPKGSHVEV